MYGSFLNKEIDLTLVGLGRNHELPIGVEDDFELRIVFSLQHFKLASKHCVRSEKLTQAHKCSHDLYIDLYRSFTLQH